MIDSARAASEDGSESSGEEEWQQDEPQEFVEKPDFTVRVQVPASASQAVSVHAESEGETDESEEVRGRWGPPCRRVLLGCARLHVLLIIQAPVSRSSAPSSEPG